MGVSSEKSDKRITSVDVAREAGLSRATVSYVLNGNSRQSIPEATRQRVLDAASRLGYRPYGPARLLRGARSSAVLMITPGLEHASDFVAAGIIRQLGDALRGHGLHLVWQLGTEQRDTAIDLAPTLVLTSAAPGDPLLAELGAQFSVPVLSAFPGLDGFIGAASTCQVQHLAETGRKALAYASPDRADLAFTSDIRLGSAQAMAARLGLREPVAFSTPPDRTGAARAIEALLHEHPSIDAICAFNDEIAFSLLAGAHDCGIAVPDRLAVIGVDNHPFGELSIPALTTVETDVSDFVIGFAKFLSETAQGVESEGPELPIAARSITRRST